MVTQDNIDYLIRPETISQLSNILLETIKFGSLSFEGMPNEQSLPIINKNYQDWKVDSKIGVQFELEVVSGHDSSHSQKRVNIETPILASNYSMTYDQLLEFEGDAYALAQRMDAQVEELRTRADLITYMGDTKYGINPLGTATPGTEVTTQLDVSSPTNALSTFSTMFKQLRSAVKYKGIAGPNSIVVVEMTPEIFATASGKTTATESVSAMDMVKKAMFDRFSQSSRVVENPYLGGSFTVDSTGVHTIVEGTDTILIYIADPRVMRTLTSGLTIRRSPVDETKGLTIQPVMRLSRRDAEPLGVLVETDVAV